MKSSKNPIVRPISGRPLTSARPMASTGLTAPKSSRGKTALRRQIQDKSYFIGLLRSKINEINNEKTVLLKECEIMSKEEARIGVYRQKAETLAKELNTMNLDLMTYNEYLDRIRIGDEISIVKDDTNEIRHENEALIINLENDYSRLRELENLVKKNDEETQEIIKTLNAIKSQFNESQRSEFNSLQAMSIQLNTECRQMENEISVWRSKKNEIEEKTVKEGNLLKMELLQAISKLRHLEKQKHELLNVDNTEENERAHLLAQVKRDNNYISSLENKIEEFSKTLEEIQNEIDFYKDGEKLMKFADLKQKEKLFDDFMSKYNSNKDELLNKIESINNEINDISNKLSRCLKYLNILKQINNRMKISYNALSELVIEKRKLELECHKNKQYQQKAENEKDILSSKIVKLQDSIQNYSDVTKLKAKIESKLNEVKQKSEKMQQDIEQTKISNESLNSEVRDIILELERDPLVQQISNVENELRELLRINEALKANDSNQMMAELKTVVLENVKKYNQNLMGF